MYVEHLHRAPGLHDDVGVVACDLHAVVAGAGFGAGERYVGRVADVEDVEPVDEVGHIRITARDVDTLWRVEAGEGEDARGLGGIADVLDVNVPVRLVTDIRVLALDCDSSGRAAGGEAPDNNRRRRICHVNDINHRRVEVGYHKVAARECERERMAD